LKIEFLDRQFMCSSALLVLGPSRKSLQMPKWPATDRHANKRTGPVWELAISEMLETDGRLA